VVAVFVAAQHFVGALSDRPQAGHIVVIVGVDYNAVSPFFNLKTRMTDPCDLHNSLLHAATGNDTELFIA
jgi:hypothetical protein